LRAPPLPQLRTELLASSSGSLLAEALSATSVARSEAAAAHQAVREAAGRSQTETLRRVNAAGEAALKHFDDAAASAHALLAAASDAALAEALAAGPGDEAPQSGPQARALLHAFSPFCSRSLPIRQAPSAAAAEPGASSMGLNSRGSDFASLMACLSLRAPILSSLPWASALHTGAAVPPPGRSGRTVVAPVSTGGYTWRVEGLTVERLRSYPPGKPLVSPPFAAGALYFQLRLFPGGDGREGSAGHLSTALQLCTGGTRARLEYDVSALDQASGLPLARDYSPSVDMGVDADGRDMPLAVAHAACSRFLSHARAASFKAELLRADTLILTARVTVTATHGGDDDSAARHVIVPPSRLAADWAHLLRSAEHADVRFVLPCSPPQTFRAHRVVLCARSGGMRALLAGGKATVEVRDCCPRAFSALLYYLYTEEWEAEPDEELASQLLTTAARFDVPRLVALAASVLARGLCVANATRTLALADSARAAGLKRAAVEFIAANSQAIMRAQEWGTYCASHPRLVADLMRTMAPGDQGAAAQPAGGQVPLTSSSFELQRDSYQADGFA